MKSFETVTITNAIIEAFDLNVEPEVRLGSLSKLHTLLLSTKLIKGTYGLSVRSIHSGIRLVFSPKRIYFGEESILVVPRDYVGTYPDVAKLRDELKQLKDFIVRPMCDYHYIQPVVVGEK